jgi:hypothetical protein
MGIVVLSLDILRRILQKAGPYLLVVLLPGGSVLALLLFLYRRRPRQSAWLNDNVKRPLPPGWTK